MTDWISSVRVAGLAALLVSTSLPAFAAASESPEDFVRRIYARYHAKGPGVPMDRRGGAAFYAPALLDAFAKDEAMAHGEVGTIDGDPLCGCQEYNLRVKSVAVETSDADLVKARVGLVNLGSANTVTLTLSRTPSGWRIADVGDKDTKSVMALLQDAASHAIGHDPSPPKP